MNNINIASALTYQIAVPTSFIFNIAAATTSVQKITAEVLNVTPNIAYSWCDLNDLGSRGLRLNVLPGELTISYQAMVQLSSQTEQPANLDEVDFPALPVEILPYLNPSRYCESDRLGQFAWNEFGALATGYSRVQAVADWVYTHIDYVAGSTGASSSACDVLIQRTGVCRDFAHVSIALCRALGIPARYVSGYAVGLEPPDFHGFFEAYLDGRWYLFDATKMAPTSGLVRIGVGRDAADASFATIVGQAILQSMVVNAYMQPSPDNAPAANAAVSTA